MPAGVTLASIFAVLIPVGIVTVVLRWLPFAFVKALKGSQFISMLGFTMPVGVMTVLVVYTLFGQARDTGIIVAPLVAAAVTAALHLWRRNSGLSIFGGTAFYMVLVNLVF
ncbi:branched-chain amino acid ABC transporter permease [Corynebacterium aurimucosum]|uniref:Branched-chain amino acid ABC transporter permease n=1 Tax=Corynebacterium aurimucosum TaxID=169292 RepID=A0A558IKZ9_9CORY|nr:AzlD domain-containing protein [Corynebacterium aurimucosum]TVU82065.1 branched-chain amino acid ABC transporter permease [Corynebacterium aurimucosum]